MSGISEMLSSAAYRAGSERGMPIPNPDDQAQWGEAPDFSSRRSMPQQQSSSSPGGGYGGYGSGRQSFGDTTQQQGYTPTGFPSRGTGGGDGYPASPHHRQQKASTAGAASDIWSALGSGAPKSTQAGPASTSASSPPKYTRGMKGLKAQREEREAEAIRIATTPSEAHAQKLQEEEIQRLQMILQEMRHNSVAVERSLHDMMFDLQKKTEECERLKHQLQLTPNQVQDAMQANEPWDPQVELFVKSLNTQCETVQLDISRDQDEKMMLLKRIDRQLNGGPSATMADTHLFTRFSRSRAATTFTKVVEALPKGNTERLNDAQFFEYCKGTVHAAVVQAQRRRTAIDVESALMTGLHYAGHRANLTRICAAIDEDDLYKL